jgi:hypothetical protein
MHFLWDLRFSARYCWDVSPSNSFQSSWCNISRSLVSSLPNLVKNLYFLQLLKTSAEDCFKTSHILCHNILSCHTHDLVCPFFQHVFYPITENRIMKHVSIRWIQFSCITPKQYIVQCIDYRWERHKSLERKCTGNTPLGKPSSRLKNNIKMDLELRREAANPYVCVMFWNRRVFHVAGAENSIQQHCVLLGWTSYLAYCHACKFGFVQSPYFKEQTSKI